MPVAPSKHAATYGRQLIFLGLVHFMVLMTIFGHCAFINFAILSGRYFPEFS